MSDTIYISVNPFEGATKKKNLPKLKNIRQNSCNVPAAAFRPCIHARFCITVHNDGLLCITWFLRFHKDSNVRAILCVRRMHRVGCIILACSSRDCLGGSRISFTISAQVFKFSISDFRPQLQPNQMSLATVQWKNKWTWVSLASLHGTHVELVIPNRCSRLSLVYSSSKPILHNSIFTLSWIMSFQRGWQFTGLAALVAWSWFPLYADFIEKQPLGSFIHINLSWVGLIGIEILLMASMDSIQ